jgi:hypothetical protein
MACKALVYFILLSHVVAHTNIVKDLINGIAALYSCNLVLESRPTIDIFFQVFLESPHVGLLLLVVKHKVVEVVVLRVV